MRRTITMSITHNILTVKHTNGEGEDDDDDDDTDDDNDDEDEDDNAIVDERGD